MGMPLSLFYFSFIIPNFLVVLISLSFSPLSAATLFRSSFPSQLAQKPKKNPDPKSNPNPIPNKTSRTVCECRNFTTPGARSWRWQPCRGRNPMARRFPTAPPPPQRKRRRSASPSSALPRFRTPSTLSSKIRRLQNLGSSQTTGEGPP